MSFDLNDKSLRECIDVLLALEDTNEKCECFDALLDSWPLSDVVTCLASIEQMDCYQLAKQIKGAKHLRVSQKPIRTIGTYYFSVANGGTERVMSRLCYLWLQMGYQVVLFTEDLGQKEEYDFPKGITRVYLPHHSDSVGKGYRERATVLQESIEKNHIDVMVYHAWTLNIALWDEMVIKAMGAAFVFHCHNIFTMSMLAAKIDLKELVTPPLLSDAVITLSEVDKTFWKYFNNNVFQVNNPFTGNYLDWSASSCEGHNILWLARIAPEKRPFDALEILKEVLKSVPDAKLHIVGAGWNKKYEKQFRKAIKDKKLSAQAIVHGYQSNVKPFYQEASVFLMTSEFEGYPMTLQESMASGLPIVMYELPHLTVTHDNPGIVSVAQENISGAARVIIELMQNAEKRKQMGMEARKYIDTLMQYDYEGTWGRIFDSIGKDFLPTISDEERRMMETLVQHHHIGVSKRADAMRLSGRKTVRAAVKVLNVKDSLHEKGLRYTLRNMKRKE